MSTTPTPIKVFISYSHDTPAHEQGVLRLAQKLREDGIDCGIDRFVNGSPPGRWPLWMERQLESMDYVLVVCTDVYLRRYNGLEEPGKGRGATWEAILTRQELYENSPNNERFVPILLEGATEADIPKSLRPHTFYRIPDRYDSLLRHITEQPAVIPNPLGTRKVLPPINAVPAVESTVNAATAIPAPGLTLPRSFTSMTANFASTPSPRPRQGRPIRIAIYTIKEEEFLAVLDRLGTTKDYTGRSGQRYKVARVSGQTTVALFRGVVQGNSEAQTLVSRALGDIEPQWVLVVGIAGGVPHKDFTIGDIVISTEVLEFTYEEKQERVTLLHPRTIPLHRSAHGVVAMMPAVLRQIPQWASEHATKQQRPAPPTVSQMRSDVPGDILPTLQAAIQYHLDMPRTDPRVVTGTVGSSNSLIKSSSALSKLTGTFKFLLCVEMEAAGAAAACNTGVLVPMLSIRGISDIVGIERDERWTQYACQTVGSFSTSLIRSGIFEDDTGNSGSIDSLELEASTSTTSGNGPGASSHRLALRNVQHFGDTDIFPRPYELGAFRDMEDKASLLFDSLDSNFEDVFPKYPPNHISTLTQVGYSGFRWASQLDPMYNVYLLSLIIKIANAIESTRLRVAAQRVFSYRFNPDMNSGRLFDVDSNWDAFIQATQSKAEKSDWVVRTDIADFYSRVSHERLNVALKSISNTATNVVPRIMAILANFAKNSGLGLPVGGPAARILAESYLNASDRLLHAKGINFCRFADDYVIFCGSEHEALKTLSELASVLSEYDGLSLQKLKTRIMKKSEFVRTFVHEEDTELDKKALSFLRLRLRYDPYSPTANEDYDTMCKHLSEYDVLGMLALEMRKSRVHQQLTKKLLHAARFIDDSDVDSAALVVAENFRSLLPVFTSVSAFLFALLPRTETETRTFVETRLSALLEGDDAPTTARSAQNDYCASAFPARQFYAGRAGDHLEAVL